MRGQRRPSRAHIAEKEAAQEGPGRADRAQHADRAQQARHSQAAHAWTMPRGGVAKPAKPHAVQGKASEAAAHASHATVHPHQEVGSTAGNVQASAGFSMHCHVLPGRSEASHERCIRPRRWAALHVKATEEMGTLTARMASDLAEA